MHCKIVLSEGVASLLPLDGVCFVNHSEIKTQGITKLNHGEELGISWSLYSTLPNLDCILSSLSHNLCLSSSQYYSSTNFLNLIYCPGDTLRLGSRTYLRFNHPQEAKQLRDISMVSLVFIK